MPKPKFNEDTREKILNCLRAGNFLTTAAGVAGVDRRSINRWRERGRAEDEEGRNTAYAIFHRDIEQAEAEAEFMLINEVRKDGPRGALEILKRRYRDRWGDRISQELTGKDGGPIGMRHGGAVTLNLTMQAPEEDPWEHGEDTEEAESQATKNPDPTTPA